MTPRVLAAIALFAIALAATPTFGQSKKTPKSGPTTRSKPALTSAGPVTLGTAIYSPPKEWKARKTTSSMRHAEFVLPKVTGDSEDAVTIIYYFGKAGAGPIDANLARWAGQMKRDPNTPEADYMKRSHKKVLEMPITFVELRGTFVEPRFGPGPKPAPKPNFIMLAAVLETPDGPYFIKTTGPAKTVTHWYKAWHAALDGLKPTSKSKE